MLVRPGSSQDLAECLELLREAPEFFSERGIEEARVAMDRGPFFVADEGSKVAGVLALTIKGPQVGEIVAMAVRRGRRGQGIGRRMVEHVSAQLRAEGNTLLEVKTLAKESGYVPYEGTRRFYERLGFRLVETVSPFPSWEPGNPCAIYVRPL